MIITAYLDPGTGAIILQAVIGAIAASAYVVKTFWRNIAEFFTSRFSGNKDDGSVGD